MFPMRLALMSGIFLAIDRCHMGRISIKIRSPNSKVLAMRVDPFPQDVTGSTSLRTGRTSDADEIGRKPVAIAAAGAPTVV
jgi:hypothetical protein